MLRGDVQRKGERRRALHRRFHRAGNGHDLEAGAALERVDGQHDSAAIRLAGHEQQIAQTVKD